MAITAGSAWCFGGEKQDAALDNTQTAFVLQQLGAVVALRASLKREADRGSLARIYISFEGHNGIETVQFERLDITSSLHGRLIEALGEVAEQLAEDLKNRGGMTIDLSHVIERS